MNKITFILFVLIALGRFEVSQSTACSGVKYGRTNSGSAPTSDARSGYGYILLGTTSNYIIGCCGIVDSWDVDLTGSTATLYLQIWRPSGTSYQLVAENAISVGASTTTPITPSSKLTVRNGDRIGWYTSGASNVIKYKSNGAGSQTYVLAMAKPAINTIESWTGASVDTNEYAIQAITGPDNAPSFTSPAAGSTYSITNDQPIGLTITTLAWSDADVGDTLTASMASNSKFAFNTTSGALTVASSLAGPSSVQTLVFTVKDYCLNSATVTLTVSIVNQPPVLYGLPASNTLSEDSTGDVLIYTINATDTVDTVTCSLVSAVTGFSVKLIPSSTKYGLYVNSNPNFNYNAQSQYTFDIKCSDGYAYSNIGTFYLYLVQNHAPVITNLQGATVVSTNATLNTNVFTVAVTDYENDTLTFDALICDPSPCPFVIRDSGNIQLTQDISGLTTTGYDLNITVRDAKHVVGPKILTVIIKDINDPVLINNLPISNKYAVSENTALTTSVFAVSISDQDTQTWTYSMSSTPATGLSYFSINPTTGLISTAGTLLNYETLASAGTTSFTFTITVSDGKSSDTEPLVIDIINVNEAPSFTTTAYSISHAEGAAGTVVGTPSFGVTDPDSGDSYKYSMTCGAYTSLFYMNPTSGQVTFQSNYDTDAGKPTTVSCTVTVTDSGGLTDTATLDIYITDINDNTPVFSPTSYSFFISYYASAGTTVGKVTATDGDTGAYGVLTYTLEQANLLDQYFTVDNTGQIVVKKTPFGNPIGYATSVTINATVTDAGGLTAKAPVTIVISDTTTTSTTTTTDRYRTFIEDNRNIAWLIPSIVALAGIGGFLTWLIYTCRGDNSFANFRRKFCNRRKQFRPRRLKTPPTPPTPPPPPRPAGFMTIRQPPPPKSEQLWRYDAEPRAPVKEPIIREHNQNYDFWKHTDFRDPRLTNLL